MKITGSSGINITASVALQATVLYLHTCLGKRYDVYPVPEYLNPSFRRVRAARYRHAATGKEEERPKDRRSNLAR